MFDCLAYGICLQKHPWVNNLLIHVNTTITNTLSVINMLRVIFPHLFAMRVEPDP